MIYLSVVSICSAQTPGISDFEIWVSWCNTCPFAKRQPGGVLFCHSSGLPQNSMEKRLDCESTVTGRYVTLVMQENDQQTRLSFSELQVMGVDAKGSIHTHARTHARTHAHTHWSTFGRHKKIQKHNLHVFTAKNYFPASINRQDNYVTVSTKGEESYFTGI